MEELENLNRRFKRNVWSKLAKSQTKMKRLKYIITHIEVF